jgi:hypothetical protein
MQELAEEQDKLEKELEQLKAKRKRLSDIDPELKPNVDLRHSSASESSDDDTENRDRCQNDSTEQDGRPAEPELQIEASSNQTQPGTETDWTDPKNHYDNLEGDESVDIHIQWNMDWPREKAKNVFQYTCSSDTYRNINRPPLSMLRQAMRECHDYIDRTTRQGKQLRWHASERYEVPSYNEDRYREEQVPEVNRIIDKAMNNKRKRDALKTPKEIKRKKLSQKYNWKPEETRDPKEEARFRPATLSVSTPAKESNPEMPILEREDITDDQDEARDAVQSDEETED